MKSVIITGGKGERLRPITYEIPKGLVPLHGRVLLDHIIDLYWKYNVYENWFVLGYKANKILDYYKNGNPYFLDGKFTGTGGWLQTIKHNPLLKSLFSTPFFSCNGDNLFNLDLSLMLKEHLDNKAIVTIACTKVKNITKYGAVHIKDNKIQSFEEKKKSRIKKSGWINGGYYIMSPEIFDYLPKKSDVSLEKDVFPKLAKSGKLYAFKSNGQWFDTGSMDRYQDIIKNWRGIT